ncbi:MAG: ABC transporter ATP-binding protein [Oligoflexia bacterium]|nr:ABC transporter ATP-binding protein [Oligoflexia bacterium]
MHEHARRQISIEATGLSVAYGVRPALRINELSARGGIIAVIGHNGAGKSTLLKSVLKLLPCSAGRLDVFAFDREVRQRLKPEEHMAFCPEGGSVFADISVESYIRLWCRLKTDDPNYYRSGGRHWIEQLELAPLLKKLGRELSKGQRRRVQTAIGFFSRPRLFLLDEPFDGLDVQKTSELAEIVERQASSTSFLLTSHRMDVVERLADTLIVLRNGELFAVGPTEEVCRTIGHAGAKIRGINNIEAAMDALKKHLPCAVMSKFGSEIIVCGKIPAAPELLSLVRSLTNSQVEIEEIVPSLVDAVSYHLKDTASQCLAA